MEKPVIGTVVAVLFPFSDLSTAKLRPALVIARAEFDNYILCQITSKKYTSKKAIKLTSDDFKIGLLNLESYIRPDKIFTADSNIIKKNLGIISNNKLKEVKKELINQFGL